MKHGLKPTLKQKKLIATIVSEDGQKLNPLEWLVYKNGSFEFSIFNKQTGKPFYRPILK